MSIKLMSAVWETVLKGRELTVMLALADWARDDGSKIYPSVAYLAWKSGVPERTIFRILKRFRGERYLIVVRQELGRPTEYRLDVGAVPKKTPFRSEWDKEDETVSTPATVSSPDKVAGLGMPIDGRGGLPPDGSPYVIKPSVKPLDTPPPKTAPQKGTRLKLDTPPPEWIAWARKEGHRNPESEWAVFHDYWVDKPGAAGLKLQWEPTWHNWVRKAIQRGEEAGAPRGTPPRRDHVGATRKVRSDEQMF